MGYNSVHVTLWTRLERGWTGRAEMDILTTRDDLTRLGLDGREQGLLELVAESEHRRVGEGEELGASAGPGASRRT